MRTAAAWCLLLPCAAAFAPAPPPESRRRALTTRSAGAGELLAEVRDLARLRPTRDDIVRLSDACDAGDGALRFLRRRKRYGLLAELLKRDAAAYADVAGWLHGACGVGRDQLPNLERVPLAAAPPPAVDDLVPDCTLTNKTFAETPLDAFLLQFTRDRYAEHTPGPAFRSRQAGILGLLEEMRVLMLDERGTDAAQQDLVIRVLLDLMTPALPPFYRLFMGGLVPSAERGDPAWLVDLAARQSLRRPGERWLGGRGPPPYAPLLTSVVAPFVFGFLVGPGRVNRRGDGARGGLVVDKCKFLQESNCKGLCLHQCKRPAERLFDDLGVPLRVAPNFETQECQWSWGVAAPAPEADDAWPDNCLAGCPNRKLLPAAGRREC